MKNLFFSSILILIFCVAAFAQTNEISPCPTIDVFSPADVNEPSEPMVFTAKLSENAKKFNLEYKWTASGGEITEGQGTLAVKVLQKSLGETTTMTLEVIGLPQDCEKTDSAAMSVIYCPLQFEIVDQFSTVAPRIDKARLDNFITSLQNNPSATGYITESFGKNTSSDSINRKNQKIFSYLKLRAFERDRIVLLNAFAKENLTQFIFVPAGVSPPSCDDCNTVK